MPRNRENPAKPWTPKQKAFVENAGQGTSMTQSAKVAGYSDYNGETDRLLANPAIRDEIINRLQKKVCSWLSLIKQGKETLGSVCLTLEENSTTDRNGRLVITVAERVAAAKTILDQVRRTDPSSLAEGAKKEDEAESRAEAVERLLGPLVEEDPEKVH